MLNDQAHLNQVIKSKFVFNEGDELDNLYLKSIAGEYFGKATYEKFASDLPNPDEKKLWSKLAKLEEITLKKLLTNYSTKELDRNLFIEYEQLGTDCAGLFLGKQSTTLDYFFWVESTLQSALNNFRKMYTLTSDERLREVFLELIEHEIEFENCCKLILNGSQISECQMPIDRHLERFA